MWDKGGRKEKRRRNGGSANERQKANKEETS